MPYSPDHKKGTRQRIVKAAAHVFNKRGFSEATIEEIMTAAGLTHGGFYRHFHSKDELYAEAVRNFLHPDVREPWQKPRPELCDPNVQFGRYVVDAYLSREHLDDLDGSCPLIGLFGNDDRAPSPEQVNEHEAALKKHGKSYEFYRYDGAGHGIFYYHRPLYRVEQALDGWNKVFAFFGKHLAK